MTPVAWLMVAPVLLMLIYALITLFSNHRRHEDLIHEVRDHRADIRAKNRQEHSKNVDDDEQKSNFPYTIKKNFQPGHRESYSLHISDGDIIRTVQQGYFNLYNKTPSKGRHNFDFKDIDIYSDAYPRRSLSPYDWPENLDEILPKELPKLTNITKNGKKS